MKRGSQLQAISFALIAVAMTACGQQRQAPVVEAIQATQSDSVDASIDANALNITEAHPSKIIGDNNLVKVKADGSNVDASIRPLVDAFGMIMIGQDGACSGTHLGNGYVLTAGHCFLDETNPADQSASNKDCSNIKVYWGYRGSPATGSAKPLVSVVSQCTTIVYAELSKTKDFAIFKVDQAPKAKVGISTDSKRTANNTKLTIFGYPQARPLEWSQYCPLKPSTTTTVGGFKGASSFMYQCDTEPGNSGSSVIGITANGSAKVVGVHDGSTPDDYNYGTFMYDIRSTLKQKGFDLDKATGSSALSI